MSFKKEALEIDGKSYCPVCLCEAHGGYCDCYNTVEAKLERGEVYRRTFHLAAKALGVDAECEFPMIAIPKAIAKIQIKCDKLEKENERLKVALRKAAEDCSGRKCLDLDGLDLKKCIWNTKNINSEKWYEYFLKEADKELADGNT